MSGSMQLFDIQIHFRLMFPLLGYHFSCPHEQSTLTKYTNKPVLFPNKWRPMGNVSHFCSCPLRNVALTYFTAASLYDTPEEQMFSNEFTENADLREMAFHYIPVGTKSSALQRELQSPETNHFKVNIVKQHVLD